MSRIALISFERGGPTRFITDDPKLKAFRISFSDNQTGEAGPQEIEVRTPEDFTRVLLGDLS